MRIEELYKLDGLEEVFIMQLEEESSNFVQLMKHEKEYYLNVCEKIHGPYPNLQKATHDLAHLLVDALNSKDDLYNRIEDCLRGFRE